MAEFVVLRPNASEGEVGGLVRAVGKVSVVTSLAGIASQSRVLCEETGQEWSMAHWELAVRIAENLYATNEAHDIHAIKLAANTEQRHALLRATHWLIAQQDCWRALCAIKERLLNQNLLPWNMAAEAIMTELTTGRREQLRAGVKAILRAT